MTRTMIITILMILTMTTVVGCGKKEPIITNDLLYRETNAVSEVSAISQYQ
jgi:hypothetical protein